MKKTILMFSMILFINTSYTQETHYTNSGLKYTILLKTFGIKASHGDEVEIKYTNYYLNGTPVSSETVTFVHGDARNGIFNGRRGIVGKGWVEGIDLMNLGEKFKLFQVKKFCGQ